MPVRISEKPVAEMSWFRALWELIKVSNRIVGVERVIHSSYEEREEPMTKFELNPLISRKRDLQIRLGFLRDHADEPEGA